MKKLLTFGLCLIASLTFCACNSDVKDDGNLTDQTNAENSSKTYTYQVSAMQGVENCVYYGPDANIPNSPNPEEARNKIHVWTKCITCGDDGESYHIKIPVEELNFPNGDTIQYTGTDSCWDCKWDKQMESFMWAVEITRVAEE